MTRVLIVEDEEHIRQNVAEALGYEGYTTIQAENGHAGVQLAIKHVPDLILCDVMMPELDGYEVLRTLQTEPATAMIPFIFLTALADRQYVRYGMDLGADDYLTKPFTPDELLSSIQTRLAKHSLAAEKYKTLLNATIEIPTASPPDSESLIGASIHGYQIWEKIGEGGAGTVYKAYQAAIGREVAIKVLREKYAHNNEMLAGTQAFSGSVGEIVVKHLQEIPSPIQQHRSKIPRAVDEVIQRAIAKNKEDRYPNVLSFAADFRKACGRKA